MPALATYELTKDYAVGFWRKRPYRALDRLTLDVEPGEVFGFLGPNGAGKTTTLKLLMQLVFPTSGTRRAPRPSARRSRRPSAASATCRRIRTSTTTSPPRSCSTTSRPVRLSPAPSGAPRVDRLLDEVGIGAERRLQLRKFSKGMLQRVGIAQALLNDPELVILDEPMSGLDPLGRRDVRALILRLRDRGCTVFFSSHVLSDAEALCSRVAILAKGRLVTAGRLTEMLAFQVRGWELVVVRRQRRAASRRSSRARTRIVRVGDGRYTFELPLDPPPDRLLARADGGGRARSSRSTRSATRSKTSSSSRSRRPAAPRAIAASDRAAPEDASMSAIALDRPQRVPRIGARQGALQPGRSSRSC